MMLYIWNIPRVLKSILLVSIFAVGITTAMAAEAPSAAEKQSQAKAFSSAEEAVKTLIDVCKKGDTQQLLVIFGPEGKEIVSSGDDVADKSNLAKFVQDYEAKNRLEQETADATVLYIGQEDWPFPVPIIRTGDKWCFDAAAGKEELLNRRIGRNELRVIEVMHAYIDAQREYSTRKDRGGNTSIEFAQKIRSDEGKRDGLYWPVKEGEEISPLGPLAAQAVNEGYQKKKDTPTPYHGYYYKILKAQGESAPGGAYNYVVDGKMILGFALVAWPADHGNSGIMTFIVNQDDIVYQKDLGADTEKIAGAIEKYDPDGTWQKAESEK